MLFSFSSVTSATSAFRCAVIWWETHQAFFPYHLFFVTCCSRDRRHIQFSPRASRPCTSHRPGPHIGPRGLPTPASGHQRLSFAVEDNGIPSGPSQHPTRGARRHSKFLRFAFGGKVYQYKVLLFGLGLAPRTLTKCMDAALAPLRLQGIRILIYLDVWLILDSRELVSYHRDVFLHRILFIGLRKNDKRDVMTLLTSDWGSLGFRSDAGPSGSCPDFQPQRMLGPLQARPSCLCEHLLQALGPYGRSLHGAAPGAASYGAVPLVDETFKVLLVDRTSLLLIKVSKKQLLPRPFNMAGPPLSSERGQYMCRYCRQMVTTDNCLTG